MRASGWAFDVLAGGLGGGILGLIVAVNIVIMSGAPEGYETSPRDVFTEHPVAGVLAVAAPVVLPLTGVFLLRRSRRRRLVVDRYRAGGERGLGT